MAVVKKNTLLYMDDNLVRAAKARGINMSEVAEAALRETLLPYMSTGERQLDFDQHLDELRKRGACYGLPFELEGVEFRNVGPVDEFKAEFKPGVNVILGPNASGKSIMVEVIVDAFHRLVRGERLTHGERSGEVKIRLKRPALEVGLVDGGVRYHESCMLLDEPAYALAPEHKRKFLAWLRRMGGQVILFTRDESFAVPSVHTIRLPRRS